MKIVANTSSRLEIEYRSWKVAVGCLVMGVGMAVAILLHDEVLTVGMVVLAIFPLITFAALALAVAENSRVVFDREGQTVVFLRWYLFRSLKMVLPLREFCGARVMTIYPHHKRRYRRVMLLFNHDEEIWEYPVCRASSIGELYWVSNQINAWAGFDPRAVEALAERAFGPELSTLEEIGAMIVKTVKRLR